jgi:UDP-N-acetylglucosamine 2-epimerase (non-hydrolysing)
VKLAPVSAAFAASEHAHVVLHTGQHYDDLMSDVFFAGLHIPLPDHQLDIGSGTHGAQTGAMLAGIESVLAADPPDVVLVYGDTNSTLAGAVAAAKLGIPIAHLEAGLRSFNRSMPEEINRVLTDHASDLLLAPTEVARGHLEREGLGSKTIVIGDVMIDVLRRVAGAVEDQPRPAGVPDDDYALATVHRAENTDDPERLRRIVAALASLPLPVVLPVHPRLASVADAAGIELDSGSLVPIDPLGYADMVQCVAESRAVVTDSGGLQKEAHALAKVTTTLRRETEWVETVDDGWNVLHPDVENGLAAVVLRPAPTSAPRDHFGDGHAAERVVEELEALVSRPGT